MKSFDMVENARKKRKGVVNEEYVSSLLQKYSATTVLSLLHEVSQMPRGKLDWDELVKKTATGITSAREYQMLWRHLAYHHSLVDHFDVCDEPLDDDSDLEFELEPFPAVSNEASAEAAACVKVLIASGSSSDANGINGSTVEAPLTINIPTNKARASAENSALANSNQGRNITVPVSVQNQDLPSVTSSENLDTTVTASSSLARRKRKPWTTEEDNELISVVKKYGEGNWAIILRSEFTGERTASQLSQRWAIIKKRQVNVREASACSQVEKLVAAHHAVSLAIDMPMGDNSKSASFMNTGTNAHGTSRNAQGTAAGTSTSGVQNQARSQQESTSGAANRAAPSGTSTRVATKRPAPKTTLSPDSMVKAAAVAAGARIATPSDAASLLKAAQSKNAVHIMPGGGGSIKKSSGPGNTSQVPNNVHFIRTGLSSHPTYSAVHPNASRVATTPQVQTKHVIPIQNNSVDAVIASNSSSELEVKTVEEVANSSSDNARRDLRPSIEVNSSKQVAVSSSSMQQVRADQAASSVTKADEDMSSVTEVKECVQDDCNRVTEDLVHLNCEANAISSENGGKMLEDPKNDSEPMDVDESKPEVKTENGSK